MEVSVTSHSGRFAPGIQWTRDKVDGRGGLSVVAKDHFTLSGNVH
jgi:hypothetical protein